MSVALDTSVSALAIHSMNIQAKLAPGYCILTSPHLRINQICTRVPETKRSGTLHLPTNERTMTSRRCPVHV